jgi:replicative DNA helicase
MMNGHLHSIETEQALLGAILVEPSSLETVSGLTEEHFYEPLHGELFGTIKRLISEGRSIDLMTIGPYFANAEPVNGLSVVQYFGRLMASVTSLKHSRDLAQVVRDFAARRAIADTGIRLQQFAGQYTASVAQTAADAIEDLDGIIAAARPSGPSWLTAEAAAKVLLDDLDNGLTEKPISTGLIDFDRVTGGLQRQQSFILAGRPSMGKSMTGIAMAHPPARNGHGVLFFSLEMAKKVVIARILSDLVWNRVTPVRYTDILKGRVPDQHDKDRLRSASRQLAGLPLIIEDQPGLTIGEIAARSRQHAARLERDGKSLDVIIVDHLDKIKASNRYAGNTVAETGEKSQGLAALAKDLNVAVLALHQLNRESEKREDRRPQLSDLRNSGDIEQDADVVSFVYRPAYYLERSKYESKEDEDERKELLKEREHDLELIVAKNRNGPITTIDLFCDVASNVVRDKA